MAYKKPLLLAGCTALVLTGLAWSADRFFIGDGRHQSTNDAYITADFTRVAPKVAGRIDRVPVADNQKVHAGDLLAHIEDDDYRTALDTAKGKNRAAEADIANLAAAQQRQSATIEAALSTIEADEAALLFARQNAARYRALSAGGASTIEQQQGAEDRQREAVARLARDKATLNADRAGLAVLAAESERAQGVLIQTKSLVRQAELDLSYCTITAPVDGVVGARDVRVGMYVHPGTGLLAVVPVRQAYVIANFQETQMARVQTGQKAEIRVDSFPGEVLRARVDSVAPATNVAFALIQPDNATGNFTKVVQRVPVKLVFDDGQPLARRVRVGMSVEAMIDTGSPRDGAHAADARFVWE